MLHVAFAGTFPASLEQPVRRHMTTPCEIIVASEIDILPRLAEIDVLVTMGLTAEMACAAPRLPGPRRRSSTPGRSARQAASAPRARS